METIESAFLGLAAALQERDAYTRSHSDRVASLCDELGKAYCLPAAEMHTLRIAARFHDIGKIGVPDHVLLKNGSLTPNEWVLMKAHPVQGERIFRAFNNSVCDQVAPIILHHHEAYDGSGYPAGLKGRDIPLSARILAISDSYDAMCTTRPYREAMSHEKILEILDAEQGRKFDPELVGVFQQVIESNATQRSGAQDH